MTCALAQVVNYGMGGMNSLHEDSAVIEPEHVGTPSRMIIVFSVAHTSTVEFCHLSPSSPYTVELIY